MPSLRLHWNEAAGFNPYEFDFLPRCVPIYDSLAALSVSGDYVAPNFLIRWATVRACFFE